jgi:hypothetical protein
MALENGYDYFYLRFRLGSANFEKGQFRIAANQFEKALMYNHQDELSQEYLYYSLLYSNQFDEARKLSGTFGNSLSEKIKKGLGSSVQFIVAEGGAKISSSTLFKPATYFQFGLGHTLGNKLSLFHAVTTYNQIENRGTIAQYQYYVQATLPLKHHWILRPSLHLNYLNYFQGGVYYPYSSYVASLNISKSYPHVDLSVGGSYSTVLIRPQYIQQTRFVYYPFGKSNFSVGSTFYIHWEDNSSAPASPTSSFSNPSPVTLAYNPFIDWSPTKKINFSANYFVNKTDNIVESNGYLINNSQDLTLSRTTFMASYALSSRWGVYGVYQFENKRIYNSISYSYNVLLIGINFKPL